MTTFTDTDSIPDGEYIIRVSVENREEGKQYVCLRIEGGDCCGDSLVGISRFYAVSKKEMVNLIRVWFGAEIADKMDRDGRL